MLRVPWNLGRPIWQDDPDFDLDFPPAPGPRCPSRAVTSSSRTGSAGGIMSLPLDHDCPLWEDWVVEGLAGGRWALVTKVHHSMVDGIAGTDLLTSPLRVLARRRRH